MCYLPSFSTIIAISNLALVVLLFWRKNIKEDSVKERDRSIQWLKTLILDHSLKHFYSFFEDIEIKLNELMLNNLSDKGKEDFDSIISDHFTALRRKFIDSLMAVDGRLYVKVLNCADDFQEYITNAIFNPDINLNNHLTFQTTVSKKISEVQTEMLKTLFEYRG